MDACQIFSNICTCYRYKKKTNLFPPLFIVEPSAQVNIFNLDVTKQYAHLGVSLNGRQKHILVQTQLATNLKSVNVRSLKVSW